MATAAGKGRDEEHQAVGVLPGVPVNCLCASKRQEEEQEQAEGGSIYTQVGGSSSMLT